MGRGCDRELGRKATTARNQMDSNRRFKQGVVLWLEYADFFYPVSHHNEGSGCFSGQCFIAAAPALLCWLVIFPSARAPAEWDAVGRQRKRLVVCRRIWQPQLGVPYLLI